MRISDWSSDVCSSDLQISVVGAIIRAGLVLCAQRGVPGALPGMWEFPGGKIEPGETPRSALEREITEELLCSVRIGRSSPKGASGVARIAVGRGHGDAADRQAHHCDRPGESHRFLGLSILGGR